MVAAPLRVEPESRYDRQERITWWDQDVLSKARVTVVGAGALGNEIVKNLVLMGVGSVVVLDFDTVEMSNLARCVLFRPEDEGEAKAPVVARHAAALNGDVEIAGVEADVRSFGTGLMLRSDVVVGALDNREARLYINRLAWRTERPWVDGAMEGLEGVARVFAPPHSCYECTLNAKDWEILDHRRSCRLLTRDEMLAGRTPTTVTTAAVVAGLQSQEVVKLLHRSDELVNIPHGGIVVSGSSNDCYPIRYQLLDDCYAHETFLDPVVMKETRDVTGASLLAEAGWSEGTVELGDDHLVEWLCPPCSRQSPASGIVSLQTAADARCPDCGEGRTPKFITSVLVPGPHADRPLVDLGVRADEVLAVRNGTRRRFVWMRAIDSRLPASWAEAS